MQLMIELISSPKTRSAAALVAVCGAVGGAIFFLGRWSASTEPISTPAVADAKPNTWTALPPADFPIPPYATYLHGITIVLDPGHVGQTDRGGDWKRGPTGLREGDVNLRVALYLRDFLVSAGARVTLTREVDRELGLSDAEDLTERSAIANRLGADLFISVHHNAVGGAEHADANYSTIYYHQSADHSPASLSAARYLLNGLNDALRLEQHLPCALVADSVVDSAGAARGGRRGYAVLRMAQVPALLVESSFHTNPREEQRLRDAVYNRREAYGLFLGLARWAEAGLPRVAIAEPGDRRVRAGGILVVGLDDGLSARGGIAGGQVKIAANSVIARVDDKPVSFEAQLSRNAVRVEIPAGLVAGRHVLSVDFENIFGQHVGHPLLEFEALPGAATTPGAGTRPDASTASSRPAQQPARPKPPPHRKKRP